MVETLIAVGIVIAVLIVLVLVIAATKPNTFQVTRSATVAAPADKVFPQVNDFHHWEAWSPWDKLDPNLKRTYSGPDSSVGAIYEWEGNNKVGKGRMEITASSPSAKLVIKLDFLKPFEAHNSVEFTFVGSGNSTSITWTMTGQQPFMFKVMSIFMNLDKMIGRDFEAGLANLKKIVETAPVPA